MATLQLVRRGGGAVHEITVPGWEPVAVDEQGGVVEAAARGGNILLRFGSPGPDFRDEIPVHDGETREVELAGRVFARAFRDRPVEEG